MASTITSKGQVTIPRELREALGLVQGSQLEFEVRGTSLVAHKVVALRVSDLWLTHPEVVADLTESANQVAAGETAGAVSFDEFARRLDAN